MPMNKTIVERNYKLWVGMISVLIPVIVGVLIFMPSRSGDGGQWVFFLPHFNAFLNSLTILFLAVGFYFIKQGNIPAHKNAMTTSFVLGSIFLVSYIIYHYSTPSAVFGDLDKNGILDVTEEVIAGTSRTIYLSLLLSHILLAIVVAPLVLLAMYFAYTGSFNRHRKVVKYAYPVWLYVSVSGVIVYFMIRPFYAF